MARTTVTRHHLPPFCIDVLNYTTSIAAAAADLATSNSSQPSGGGSSERAPPLEALLPASHRRGHIELDTPSMSLDFLGAELGLQRLEGFNQWFWLLSSPCLPRPLHDCAFLGRDICITESMDRHLGLGRGNNLYLKPVPRILLDPRFWADFLPCDDGCWYVGGPYGSGSKKKCARRQLFECGLGFLFSYTALVSHESDFHLAKAAHLLPAEVSWDGWRILAKDVICYPDLHDVIHKRFLYGELRLHRLKEISQLRRGGLLQVLVGRLDLFARFFQNNARWLASLVAYIAIVLTALQVGLAQEALMDSPDFQSFSYGFTVFSLVAPVGVMIGFGIYFGVDLLYYVAWNLIDAKHGESMRRRRMAKTKNKLSADKLNSVV